MNLTNYEQSKALAALGYPQDGWPQLVYRPHPERDAWIGPDWWTMPPLAWPYIAVTDVLSAIMWLLASERGRKLWGAEPFLVSQAGLSAIMWPFSDEYLISAATPSGLLDAMLAAVTEATCPACHDTGLVEYEIPYSEPSQGGLRPCSCTEASDAVSHH